MKFDNIIKNLLTKVLRSPIIFDSYHNHPGRTGGGSLPKWAGKAFKKNIKLSPEEKAKVDSAINTVFKARFTKNIGKMCSIAVGDYWYAFVPNEFNEYGYKHRIQIKGNEDDINALEEELYKK